MNRKKGFMSAGALFMGLVIILGMIGIVNGLWSKNLVIDGTVETGDLNADWDCAWTNDDGAVTDCAGTANDEPAGSDTGLDPKYGDSDYTLAPDWVAFTHPAKNVGKCTVDIDPDDGGTEFDEQWARVEIENAYPSYECDIVLALSNTGSIPFNIIGIGASLEGNEDGIEFIDLVPGAGNGECLLPATPSQVDPESAVPGSNERLVKCRVHVKQTAFQSEGCNGTGWGAALPGYALNKIFSCTSTQTYSFVLNGCVAQWNEGATLTECKGSDQHEGSPEITPAPPSPNTGPNPPAGG